MSNNKFTLTLLDTASIQDYIFSSNRLQENIGASEIVYRATTLWVFEALAKVVGTAHNIHNGGIVDWSFDETKHIEKDPNLLAEVVQAAGGNTVILFRKVEDSRNFVRRFTFHILKEAPGLTVLAQHDDEFEFGISDVHLPAAFKILNEEKMKKHKLWQHGSTPLRGLGVTAMCDSTGLPAVTTLGGTWKSEPLGLPGEDKNSLSSVETAAKRGRRKAANGRLNHILKNALEAFTFPYDLEKIGRNKGEESYIAVVHVDGNRIGMRVREIGENAKNDRDFIQNLRAFSKKIETISRAALESAVGLVVQAVKKKDIPCVEDLDEDGEGVKRKFLPFRPLVFGGDDVTFVCNGLIGVSLAASYLEAFESEAKKQGLEGLHACAGVSIVKLHYPFTRAYKLADELIASAKKMVKKSDQDFSALDWHFAQSGLSGSLKVIREREYTVKDGSLTMRPVTLSIGPRSWKTVQNTMKTFKIKWAERHNKVIGLREPLRNGPVAVNRYLQDFDLLKEKLPVIPELNVHETGWQENTCYYFDAIELLDHYVSLETVKEEEKA